LLILRLIRSGWKKVTSAKMIANLKQPERAGLCETLVCVWYQEVQDRVLG
jgi:hypothetical protein